MTVVSGLVEQVIAYLDELERDLSKLPNYFPEHLRAPERKAASFHHIRQTVNIVEDRKIFETWAEDRIRGLHDPERREGRFAYRYEPHRAAVDSSKIKTSTPGDLAESANEWETDFDLEPMPFLPMEWDEHTAEEQHRAVILADPGMGKSWLLRHEAIRVARQSRESLMKHEKSLDEITLPLFHNLTDLSRSDEPIEDILLRRVGLRKSTAFTRFVRQKLVSDRCLILLDALDEVREGKKALQVGSLGGTPQGIFQQGRAVTPALFALGHGKPRQDHQRHGTTPRTFHNIAWRVFADTLIIKKADSDSNPSRPASAMRLNANRIICWIIYRMQIYWTEPHRVSGFQMRPLQYAV